MALLVFLSGSRALVGPIGSGAHGAPLLHAVYPLAAPKTPKLVPATLTAGPYVGNVSPEFWATVAQTTTYRGFATDPSIGTFVNATPFQWFTYGELSDQCDVPLNVYYLNNGTAVSPCPYNVSAFANWCHSRPGGCNSIMILPGELNNSTEDAVIANYIVNKVGFQPTYWAIGNEPELWTHYGKPWTSWATYNNRAPSAMAYAWDVHAAIAAVRPVDPAAKFIGIEADCACGGTWFDDVIAVNGPNISAVAFHTYPTKSSGATEPLQEFYAALMSTGNLTNGLSQVQSTLASFCSSCGGMPIFVTEYNSGPGDVPSEWSGTYANAVFLAASTAQALRVNLSMFSIFNLQSASGHFAWAMMNETNVLSPEGLLYQDLLPHLNSGRINAVSIATKVDDVWGVLTVGSSTETLLVVNANFQKSIALNVSAILPRGSSATEYLWDPSLATPSATGLTLQGPVALLSQAILLLVVPLGGGVSPPP